MSYVEDHRKEIRAPLLRFCEQQELLLRTHDEKKGYASWKDDSFEAIQNRLKDEFFEYFDGTTSFSTAVESIKHNQRELLDIANFCMMLHDKYDDSLKILDSFKHDKEVVSDNQ